MTTSNAKSVSDIAFEIDGVESVDISKVGDLLAVRTNLNRILPVMIDPTSPEEEIREALLSAISIAPPVKRPAYKTRQSHIALLVEPYLGEVWGWTITDLPSGRLVFDTESEDKTPLLITRDKVRYGGGVEDLSQHPICRSEEQIPASRLAQIPTSRN